MDKNSSYLTESQEEGDSLVRRTLMGLLLGMAIGWVLLRYRRTTEMGRTNNEKALNDHEFEIPLSPMDEIEDDTGKVTASTTAMDPLETIKGIGPVFAKRLNQAGILTFRDLAEKSPEQLAEIVQAKQWQAVEIQAWITQAEQLRQ